MVKGFLKSVFAPMAMGTIAGSAVPQLSHLLTEGEFMGAFTNATSVDMGVAAVSSMLVAGATGYALGKWKPKPMVVIPS
jgi:ABC-type uncharacterized transport system permease subunit